MNFIALSRLRDFAQMNRELYSLAEPFPHIVIDNFLPEKIMQKVMNEFPKPGEIDWITYNSPAEKKLASKKETQMGKITRFVLQQLNSSVFVDFLETLTGISGLIPDPHFLGGGLHQIERGGLVKIHTDFSRNNHLRLDHRLTLLLYLNKNWQEEYGGHLELWNRDMTECVQRILPIFNRCVLFTTTPFSYHGHPEPLNCPQGQTRKSLTLHYYTNGRPTEEVSTFSSTVWKERPGEKISTLTLPNPKTIIKKLIPPIFIDIKNYLKQT